MWESSLHGSTFLQLLMQHIREEVWHRVVVVVGNVRTPRDVWDKYVPSSFVLLASKYLSLMVPLSD